MMFRTAVLKGLASDVVLEVARSDCSDPATDMVGCGSGVKLGRAKQEAEVRPQAVLFGCGCWAHSASWEIACMFRACDLLAVQPDAWDRYGE